MFLYRLDSARGLTRSSLVCWGLVFFPNWRIGVNEYFNFVVSLNVLMIVFDEFLIEGGILYEQLLDFK
jgi:hypothetical protein